MMTHTHTQLEVDRQMSAYEMEKSLEAISMLIKKEARGIRISCAMSVGEQAKETLDETVEQDENMAGRFDSLERALEGLSGMAIAAINRDKQQQMLLEHVSTRLTDLERKVTVSSTTSPPCPCGGC